MDYASPPLPLDLFALGRGAAYLATVALVGTCVFMAMIPGWRHADDDERSLAARALGGAWRLARFSALLLVAAHLVRGYGQVRSFLEPGEPLTWAAARPLLTTSTWGRGWMAQTGLALAALALTPIAARRPAPGLALLGAVTLAAVGASPLTGHAGEHPWGAGFGIGLHAVHLLGGGLWLGTLAAIVALALPRVQAAGDHTALARLIAAFSPLALAGAAMAVGAGTALAWAYVGDLAALTGTSYGRALLLKTGLLLVIVGLGAWNWRRVTPRLGQPAGTARLRRSATLEVGLGLLLLAVTAVLVALPAPKI